MRLAKKDKMIHLMRKEAYCLNPFLTRRIVMNQSTTSGTQHFSGASSLAALGLYVQEIKLFEPIRQQVHIPQKQVKDHPMEKLYDLWIAMLAGLERTVELNSVLRADGALQRAFGRSRCAEQSVVQQTLDACTPETIEQMRAVLTQIARQYGRAWQSRLAHEWLILDVDLCALPCGKQAEHATKGYLPGRKGQRGRQLGRVYASQTEEIVADLLYEGHTHLSEVLQALVEQAQENLQLDETARRHTLLRFDAGGGTIDNINWLFAQGYGVLCKEYSGKRAKALAKTIEHWITDPSEPGRSLGIVSMPCLDYRQPHLVRRLVVRTLPPGDPQAQPSYSVLLCNLVPEQVFSLLGQPASATAEQEPLAQATQDLYDLRGGGVETSYKGDKHGLGLSHRNKKRFGGQQMLTLLSSLAHNVLIWARSWLFEDHQVAPPQSGDDDLLPEDACMPADPQAKLRRYGIKRLVRDVLHLSGCLHFRRGKIVAITFNQAAPLAPLLATAFQRLLAHQSVVINLDQI
jgi:hypothetical protein